ncbi:MOSC domain-containing protein [Fulvivirga sediminis]|uniref:MOSC domain-containing protein n=1 Tax=Fulvivirga sediminis TaxID=2803949 RepID=A0A937F673_9BACT|nr:MOSC N-terminal beta barrel domain-containing protein [Fulvivirga sediminis]MBL3655050.1 MOSC domain-containing protein [Fulvivirga sediminis]
MNEIIIYPIKSLPGVRLNEAKVESRGLQYDRRYMLVDENNRFITARKHSELLSFVVTMEMNGFKIKDRESGDCLTIPFQYENGKPVEVSIWDDTVDAIECEEEWGSWIGEKAGLACKLVYMPDSSQRRISGQWSTGDETVSFADGYPILMIGSESLHDINEKAGAHLSVDRFRGNLIFSGGEAYDELRWKDFKIGYNNFKGLKPCVRCVLTTIDPITGERGKEPLATLAKQKVDGKVVFGQHAIPIDFGEIKVGDDIEVLSYKDSPYDPL